ncbi:hypothetical protein ATEIFO6365_0006073800 [Aspergillus terreus]|uniref:Uncharacterized protein n=1 Tax=Aspergillus terreus TaxID=33178 RepID=A0A5M3YXQ7_ASPTE|nr:hypothetical protein ATETN484_0005073800 [Aspergillus terreus]GFF17390.1 hypothetical protein ATEIFO6365_0006073800 [Aspergillus terreus]
MILRPGDFIDPTRQKKYPDPPEGPSFLAPETAGILHDIRDDRFYSGGTLSLTTQTEPFEAPPSPIVYDPYPDYNSREWKQQWKGYFYRCIGPRGTYLDHTSPDDMVSAYPGTQRDFPFPMFGSYDAIDLDGNVCFDRYSRYKPYGYGLDTGVDVPAAHPSVNITWDEVDWADLQAQCLHRNAKRYKGHQTKRPPVSHPLTQSFSKSEAPLLMQEPAAPVSGPQYQPRSAVLIRAWHTIKWTPNHLQYLRSLLMELSLHSGAEYEVFLLIDVKDDFLPIFSDASTVQYLKDLFIPTEFRNMTIFFNNKLLEGWYPLLEEHRPMYQHLQPVQIFSQLYPDFDYYWQFEMDSRNIGHMYHFLDRAVEFAKQQPRKYLWERNAYFYTPGAHGPWEQFMGMVNESMVGRRSVWGPVPAKGIMPTGPMPPVSTPEEDDYEWGVGEEADLITFLPIFDPSETTWTFPDTLYNLPLETPRRASPVTMWRLSKRLLDLMHHDQATTGIGLGSEMSGPTWALWHGFKAVHVPHPLYLDGHWTAKELSRVYNPGEPDKINGGPHSVWNWNHMVDRIMYRFSYMFTTQTAEDLYRRWLGYPPDPSEREDGRLPKDTWGLTWYEGGQLNEETYGRLCFPPMFLHTIKNTEPEKGPDKAVPV